MVDRQLADFVCDSAAFKGQTAAKNITDQFYLLSIGRLSLGLGKRFGVDLPSVDYRSTVADTPPTSIFKMSHSNLADCQPIIWRQLAE